MDFTSFYSSFFSFFSFFLCKWTHLFWYFVPKLNQHYILIFFLNQSFPIACTIKIACHHPPLCKSPLPISSTDQQHSFGLLGLKQYNRWKCWWVALTFTIWQHRNRTIFSNEPFNGSKMMEDAMFLVWSWFRELEKGFTEHYNY